MMNEIETLRRITADIRRLQDENDNLLVKKGLTDRFRRGVADGQLTETRFNELVAAGNLLNRTDYKKAEDVLAKIEDIKNRPLSIPSGHSKAVETLIKDPSPELGGIITPEPTRGEPNGAASNDVSTQPGDRPASGPRVGQREPSQGIPSDEEGRRAGRVLPDEGQGNLGIRREIDEQRDNGSSGVALGRESGDLRAGARLEEPEPLIPGSSGTSLPHDVILDSASDIGATAGAAVRFDANLEAIRTLKRLEDEGRQATPTEQAILAKYSGFGDSAFNDAFRSSAYGDSAMKRRGEALKATTTPEEYEAIERSRVNAFYTTPEVIDATWQALRGMGIEKLPNIRVLEPSAGSGRYLGFQPPDLAARSQRVAVELDQMTGKILKHLYPNAEVYAGIGYQEAPIPNDSIDVALSNVPFGNFAVHDPAFTKSRRRLTRQIHNYFFAKSLEQLRPGGVLAFVTSHNTLDAPKAKAVREALAEQADLVGAIRLPKTAFPDTEVVTDILFMRKRLPDEAPKDTSWIDTGEIEVEAGGSGYRYQVPFNVNKYFLDHPEMVLGKHSASGSMYRQEEYSVDPPDFLLSDGLRRAVERLPKDIVTDAQATAVRAEPLVTPLNVKDGVHLIGEDGLVYVNKNGTLVKSNLASGDVGKIKELLAIRDATRAVINTQLKDATDQGLKEAQTQLNSLYDGFVGQHGAISSKANVGLLKGDPDAPLLAALEIRGAAKISKALKKAEADEIKMPLFTQRTIHGLPERTINSEADAIAVSLNELGRLDFKRMAEITGVSQETVRDTLSKEGRVYQNPVGDWESADEYLTGDVREKLRIAEAAASINPRYRVNVESLKLIQPADLPPSQISVRLGVPWIPEEDVTRFVTDLLRPWDSYRRRNYFRYLAEKGEWLKGDKISAPESAMRSEWGTSRMAAGEILIRLLNGKPVEVNDRIDDKSVRNPGETLLAQEKAAAVQQAFKEWVWKDPDRAERLAKIYNTTFNGTRPRVFDGSHQELPGISLKWDKQLHPHQRDAIWRVVQDRTALLAHEVGFGKTAVMVGSGMELRRLGLAQKNLYVVPKATHGQFLCQFLDLYPHAKVLFPTDRDFSTENRAEFISRAVTGDWDAVILSDTQFRRIPLKPETQIAFLKEEVDTLREALESEENVGGSRTRSHKELQKALLAAQAKIQETQAGVGQVTDNTLFFEDMGVDQMYIDEADMFKNLGFATKMGRLKGLPNSNADRAWDMYQKVRHLQNQGRNHGIVFATGTPVANTIAEMYTMMRYLQRPMLEAKGLSHFDPWAKTFGETTETIEQNVTGKYVLSQRFAKFANAPELSNLWQQVADIRVADEVPDIGRLRPRVVDDQGKEKRTVVAVPPDQALIDFMQSLARRAENLKSVSPEEDNMLKISSDARMAALDMRMVDPEAPPNPNGKVTAASRNIARIYHETTPDKGAQLVFLDLGTPRASEKAGMDDPAETIEEDAQVLRNVYEVIKDTLVAAGIPANEIAFAHDAKNDNQRQHLYQKVNDGDIRILIGSTGKMGAGVNVQKRAAALHHMDAPWRPRDIEQREGRLVRQGNEVYGPKRDADGRLVAPGPGVRIYNYVTERSFDAYMWQTVEAKAKAIKSIMRRENPPREIEDIDSLTLGAGEAKALASGNPDVLKAVTLKNQVLRIEMLRASHTDARVRSSTQLKNLPRQISELASDIGKIQEDAGSIKTGASFSLSIGGRAYSERPKAAEALKDVMEATPFVADPDQAPEIGDYKGFTVRLLKVPGMGYKLMLRNPSTGYVHTTKSIPIEDLSAAGAMQRLDNRINNIPAVLEQKERELHEANTNLATYKMQADAPFEHEGKLVAMKAELDRLEGTLQGKDVSDQPAYEFEMLSDEPLDGEKPTFRFTARGDEPQMETKPELAAVQEQAVVNLEEPHKEPWELPYEEWRDHESRITGEDLEPTAESRVFHKEQVLEAVEDDVPVPDEVIEEYKDIAAQRITPPKEPKPRRRLPKAEAIEKGRVLKKARVKKGRFDINRDRAIQAKTVVPKHPKTEKELRLQRRWEKTPNRLDKEGVDTKIVRPKIPKPRIRHRNPFGRRGGF